MKTEWTSMKFEYDLIWNGEVIYTASTKKEALYLKTEYLIAMGGTIEIKKVRKDESTI